MSVPDSPDDARSLARPEQSPSRNIAADPERVLTQALRAMAGGGRPNRTGTPDPPDEPAGARPPLTVVQIALIATIFGLLVGMTIGLLSLLV